MSVIRSVHGRQVLDSRGRPTVEVEVGTDDGVVARASVPSGASTGTHEAHELRDGDRAFFGGLGVLSAVAHVNAEIAAALRGHDVVDQQGCDRVLRELDGTPGLSRLGANAVLGASLATCRASAKVTAATAIPADRRPRRRRAHTADADGEHLLRRPARRPRDGRPGLPRGADLGVHHAGRDPAHRRSPGRGHRGVCGARPANPARGRRRAQPGLPNRPGAPSSCWSPR